MMKHAGWVKFFKSILGFVFIGLFGMLLYSTIRSGLLYTYDIDEFLHVQKVYLLMQGYRPYLDFFTNHSGFFHYLLMPVFSLTGFTVESIRVMRGVMIVVFLVRLLLTVLLVRKLFGFRVAVLTAFFLLFDPFLTFVGMQIRPDNLMLIILVGGLYVCAHALERGSERLLAVGGALLSLAFLVQMKSALLIAATCVVVVIVVARSRHMRSLAHFLCGIFFPVLLYVLMHLVNGTFTLMVEHLFIDAVALQQTLPTQFGLFYQPNNAYIYGLGGQPFVWVWAWVSLMLAAMGTSVTVMKQWGGKTEPLKYALVAGVWLQFLSLFFTGGVFAQYYQHYTWMISIFAAVLVGVLLGAGGKRVTRLCMVVAGVAIMAISWHMYHANSTRATISWNTEFDNLAGTWAVVGEDETVYPNVLFREAVYPMVYGYDPIIKGYPESIQKKMPPIVETLIINEVDYVLADDIDGMAAYLDPRFPELISSRYEKVEGSTKIYKRIVDGE